MIELHKNVNLTNAKQTYKTYKKIKLKWILNKISNVNRIITLLVQLATNSLFKTMLFVLIFLF